MDPIPAISVVIPTCNRPELLRVALKSLVRQTFTDFEAVVVNDGEEDVTALLAEFDGKLRLGAVRHSPPRQGLSAARNSGIAASRGRFLVYLDDDDFFYHDHLQYLHRAVCELPYKVVYTDALLATQRQFDGEYETLNRYCPISRDFDHAVLACRNLTPVLCLLHARECLARTALFAPYLRAHEDWDLWQRMARHYPFHHLPFLTAEYLKRLGSGSMSDAKSVMAYTWLFVRRQGMLHSALPPVYTLEERAKTAVPLGEASGPCRASVVLPVGDAAAFLRNPALVAAFDALCGRLGDAQPVLAGFGEAMADLCGRGRNMARPCRAVRTAGDCGTLFSANLAAGLAEGEWLVFLEPGVVPPAPEDTGGGHWLDILLDAAKERPDAVALGGALHNPRTGLVAGGDVKESGELLFRRLPKDSAADSPVDCLSSLCLMLRRERFFEAGGFNPAFAPGHYADADLCLRLKARGGICLAVPRARFVWSENEPALIQSPAGLVSRRTFWDTWSPGRFPASSLTEGVEWSMRPQSAAELWPSAGRMPANFRVALPESLR